MRALAAWREHDIARAIHAVDRDAIASTESARALVLELLASPDVPRSKAPGESPRDLYNACAALGRLLAEAGASPSLAVTTMDGAARALDTEVDPSRLSAARASLSEAYVTARLDAERAAARNAWEYPACCVRLEPGSAAILAGYPTDDRDAIADWAARVALGASKDRLKTVFVGGPEPARSEITSALALVGIDAQTDPPVRREPWFKLPWRK